MSKDISKGLESGLLLLISPYFEDLSTTDDTMALSAVKRQRVSCRAGKCTGSKGSP